MADIDSNKTGKRPRVDTAESPETKRLREDLLDILEDESGDRNPTIQDLASVMKSLEEEIGLPFPDSLPPPSLLTSDSGESQPELGFLLEASDDELGLPPTSSGDENSREGGDALPVAIEAAGFDPIWGFADDMLGSGFGFCAEGRDEEESVVFGGLFDFPDVSGAASEFSEFSWRTESLPAL